MEFGKNKWEILFVHHLFKTIRYLKCIATRYTSADSQYFSNFKNERTKNHDQKNDDDDDWQRFPDPYHTPSGIRPLYTQV